MRPQYSRCDNATVFDIFLSKGLCLFLNHFLYSISFYKYAEVFTKPPIKTPKTLLSLLTASSEPTILYVRLGLFLSSASIY